VKQKAATHERGHLKKEKEIGFDGGEGLARTGPGDSSKTILLTKMSVLREKEELLGGDVPSVVGGNQRGSLGICLFE